MDCSKREDLHRLYERVGRAAILKTARVVGRIDVAEEIVQGAFLKLWDAGLSFPDERAAFAWIYRTCHNAGIDHIRAHATKYESGLSIEQMELHGAEDAVVGNVALRQSLLTKLGGLSEREAQVLAYRLLDGMTQSEIAEVMGLSRKTIVRVCSEIDAKFSSESPLAGKQGH